MADKTNICIVGGGAAGLSLAWALTSQQAVADQCTVTVIHNEARLGGHSLTIPVQPDGSSQTYLVDLGVQFVCGLLYPNLHEMLKRPEFAGQVVLDEHPQLKISATFQPELNWGNFANYRDPANPVFAQLSTERLRVECLRFEAAVDTAALTGHLEMKLADYFCTEAQKGAAYSQDFINYFLMPYLSILNGYGGTQMMLDATFVDLVPIFIPLNKGMHGLGSFNSPGVGWQRFHNGSSTWIDAMASFAAGKGATFFTDATVTSVASLTTAPDTPVRVSWVETPPDGNAPATRSQDFDVVVLTTDMTANREMLDRNPFYGVQQPYISDKQFPLKGGACFIHQDEGVFPPYFKPRDETIQFTAYYARGGTHEPYDTPYDVTHTYSTWVLNNIVPGMPSGWYLSMYGHDVPQHPPANPYYSHQWRHGHFLGSYFYDSAKQLHHIQGLGNVWFAGNNTLQDSEEGALISAMIVASKLFPQWQYPFAGMNEADALYRFYEASIMFPAANPVAQLHWRNSLEARVNQLEKQLSRRTGATRAD